MRFLDRHGESSATLTVAVAADRVAPGDAVQAPIVVT
jgi:hypothetical protein